jgi:hypothetical protein
VGRARRDGCVRACIDHARAVWTGHRR